MYPTRYETRVHRLELVVAEQWPLEKLGAIPGLSSWFEEPPHRLSDHGPFVKIQVKPGNYGYLVSKRRLCRESQYFLAMFEKDFKEGQEQTGTLEEIEGVISARSLEALLQWFYLRRVKFELEVPEDQILAAIELARLADMCSVTGLESRISRYIKDILIANPMPEPSDATERHVDINSYCLTS